MKRPKTALPKRPRQGSAAVARTPREAAIRLVRLEFDAARLETGIAQALERATSYREELAQNAQQRACLLDILERPARLGDTR